MSADVILSVDAYSKAESDEKYELKGQGGSQPVDAYTKAETDAKFVAVDQRIDKNDDDIADLTGRVTDLEQGGGGTPSPPGTVDVPYTWLDGLGSNDNERIAAMNDIAQSHGGAPGTVFVADVRKYAFSTQIETWSGLKIEGTNGMPAREFGRATIFHWDGGSGTSMFKYTRSQSGQGYPSDGSPRNMEFAGIQFEASAGRHLFEKVDPGLDFGLSDGKRLWYCSFHGCGVVGFDTVIWGYGTGVDFFSDNSHMQAVNDTALKLAGSENSVYGGPGRFLQDSSTSAWASSNKPFLISRMEKSSILDSMLSARGNSYQILIEAGSDIQLMRVQLDAPDGSPTQGAPLRIKGGTDISVMACGFKGHMTNPGASGSRGIIDIFGGDRIIVQGNHLQRKGSSVPATSTPLIVSSGAKVKIGLNNFDGYEGVYKGPATAFPVVLDTTMRRADLTRVEQEQARDREEAAQEERERDGRILAAYRTHADAEKELVLKEMAERGF